MPNGRSSDFSIYRKEFLRLLEDFSDETVIGSEFARLPVADVTVSQLKTLLIDIPKKFYGVYIEEQVNIEYIVHFGKPKVVILQDSPIYKFLREHHSRWPRRWVHDMSKEEIEMALKKGEK